MQAYRTYAGVGLAPWRQCRWQFTHTNLTFFRSSWVVGTMVIDVFSRKMNCGGKVAAAFMAVIIVIHSCFPGWVDLAWLSFVAEPQIAFAVAVMTVWKPFIHIIDILLCYAHQWWQWQWIGVFGWDSGHWLSGGRPRWYISRIDLECLLQCLILQQLAIFSRRGTIPVRWYIGVRGGTAKSCACSFRRKLAFMKGVNGNSFILPYP